LFHAPVDTSQVTLGDLAAAVAAKVTTAVSSAVLRIANDLHAVMPAAIARRVDPVGTSTWVVSKLAAWMGRPPPAADGATDGSQTPAARSNAGAGMAAADVAEQPVFAGSSEAAAKGDAGGQSAPGSARSRSGDGAPGCTPASRAAPSVTMDEEDPERYDTPTSDMNSEDDDHSDNDEAEADETPVVGMGATSSASIRAMQNTQAKALECEFEFVDAGRHVHKVRLLLYCCWCCCCRCCCCCCCCCCCVLRAMRRRGALRVRATRAALRRWCVHTRHPQ
jgi:hypothetical protein